MDVKEVYIPPIPETIEDIQEHIRTLCDLMDKIGRQREAAKVKLEILRKQGPSLQKEKGRRKLESENRELKRQLSEIKDTIIKLQTKVTDLGKRIKEQDQYSRKINLRFNNINYQQMMMSNAVNKDMTSHIVTIVKGWNTAYNDITVLNCKWI
ncbi:unnamed protein product [Mytilus edulis]|uniref:Uncharacterized protein n=1 Tax=Mytilus edulis TaxID=6550 RepID=A0A8S3SVE5_MYTED|nr:unnamed protein product [Mytilus edulis]